jgi:hypothetical protein
MAELFALVFCVGVGGLLGGGIGAMLGFIAWIMIVKP